MGERSRRSGLYQQVFVIKPVRYMTGAAVGFENAVTEGGGAKPRYWD